MNENATSSHNDYREEHSVRIMNILDASKLLDIEEPSPFRTFVCLTNE